MGDPGPELVQPNGSAGRARSCRPGRWQLFEFRPEPIAEAQNHLGDIAL